MLQITIYIMKKINLRTLLLLLSFTILFTACEDDDDDHDHENEVITTLRLTFTKTDANGVAIQGVNPITAIWKDADGSGANPPTVDNINLSASSYYKLDMAILNELANPAQDLTSEIRNEGTKHQFFFQITGNQLNPLVYDDQDTDGKPIGLQTKLSTKAGTGSHTLKVILRHEPNKNGANVSMGDIANAGGETDIETTPAFTLNVQ